MATWLCIFEIRIVFFERLLAIFTEGQQTFPIARRRAWHGHPREPIEANAPPFG